jgi:MFS family permease
LALSGLIFNGTTPAMVGYAHQLFPRGAGFASALTMGFSWGLAGILVAKLTTYCNQAQHPEWLYLAFVPGLLVAALGAAFLPRPRDTADHSERVPAPQPAVEG